MGASTKPGAIHLTTTYQATGDHARDSGAAAFDGPTSHSYYYLTGVDVATRGPEAVVAFGDSITNGHNSTVDGNDRYTDALAERLIAAHSPLSVANAGITGNLLLHQLPCFGEPGSPHSSAMPSTSPEPHRHLDGRIQRHLGLPG